MITVENVQGTLDFYREQFEFSVHYNSNANRGYVFKDAAEIMFSVPNVHLPFARTIFTGSLYTNTDNVDHWWNKLKNQIEIVCPLEHLNIECVNLHLKV